ncbi:uncharacterized protein [Melanerpes formicivorus]|uniref:uncharacterized protein isoform X3 n=1 Tax=Melanerpes formicivorus TaxID=211600 RepID=UPI00358F9D9B
MMEQFRNCRSMSLTAGKAALAPLEGSYTALSISPPLTCNEDRRGKVTAYELRECLQEQDAQVLYRKTHRALFQRYRSERLRSQQSLLPPSLVPISESAECRRPSACARRVPAPVPSSGWCRLLQPPLTDRAPQRKETMMSKCCTRWGRLKGGCWRQQRQSHGWKEVHCTVRPVVRVDRGDVHLAWKPSPPCPCRGC